MKLLLLALTALAASPVTADTYSYIGCYTTQSVREFLTRDNDYTYQSSQYCSDSCSQIGKPVAATYQGGSCYCGDTLPSDLVNSGGSGTCNTACFGYNAESCGGSTAFSVYVSGDFEPSDSSDSDSDSDSETETDTDGSSSTDSSDSSSTADPQTSTTQLSSTSTDDSAESSTTSSAASPVSSTSSTPSTSSASTPTASTTSEPDSTTDTTSSSPTSVPVSTAIITTHTNLIVTSVLSTEPGATSTTTDISSDATNSSAPETTDSQVAEGAGESKKSSNGLSGGAIAGIVVGSLVGAALIAAALLYYFCTRRHRENADSNSGFDEKALAHLSDTIVTNHDGGYSMDTSDLRPVDQRLDPAILGFSRLSVGSLPDACDHSRKIFTVTNPDV